MKHDLTPPTRALKSLAWVTRVLLWLLLAAWGLFALTWGALHGLIVPRIGDFRPQLESMAGRALGVPVTVGDVRATSAGAVPAFELYDVRLFDPQGREALHLPRVLSSLSVWSIWRWGFEQLVIDSPTLDMRRTTDGRVWVAGLLVSDSAADSPTLANWFFDQPEFVIRNGRVRWHDEVLAQAPLQLDAVNFVVRNQGRQHRLRLDATPPAPWGARFSLQGDFRQPLELFKDAHWKRWSGTLYAHFDQVDLQHLKRHIDTPAQLGVSLDQGRGALRLWTDWQSGSLRGVTTDLALEQVALRLAPELPALGLSDMHGRVHLRLLPLRSEFSSDNLRFRTAAGDDWPAATLWLAHTGASQGRAAEVELRAGRLDLGTLGWLAAHVPLSTGQRQWLRAAKPAGVVHDLKMRWDQGPENGPPVPARWQATARVEGLALAPGPAGRPQAADDTPSPGRPGVQALDLRLDANQDGGRVDLAMRNGRLSFPGVFEEPNLVFDELGGELNWKAQGEQWRVTVPALRFANADAEGELAATWHSGEGKAQLPGVLDLSGRLVRADGARVHRYLPLGVTEDARHYVRDAVLRGRASDARFKVKGALERFPFVDPTQGEFHIEAQLSEVDYDYVPTALAGTGAGAAPWPGLRGLSGQFVLDRNGLRLDGFSGTIAGAAGVRVVDTRAEINDFMGRTAVQVWGNARGPASEMLAFVNRSPVADMTEQALAQARMSGNSELQLQLNIPLSDVNRTTVRGAVTLAGNDVLLRPDTPLLAQTSGRVVFTEQGFSVPQAQARVWGGELRFDGGMRRDAQGVNRLAFQGQGQLVAEGLRQARELAALAPLTRHFSGSSAYQIRLAFDADRPKWTFSSDLQGVALALPAPLTKAAADVLPLRLASAPLPAGVGGVAGERLSLDLGPGDHSPLVSAVVEQRGEGSQAQVLRGAFVAGTGVRAALPSQGVSADLRLAELDLQAWEQALTGPAPSGPSTTSPLPPQLAVAAYLPSTYTLHVDRLRALGRDLHSLRLQGQRDGGRWRAQVTADEVDGQLEYRAPADDGPGRVFARLARLQLKQVPGNEVEQLLQAPPSSVPALDIVVERFVLGERQLGRVEIEAVNRGGGPSGETSAREWRLTRLNMSVPEARLSGSGNWAQVGAQQAGTTSAAGGQRRSVLNFQLDIADAGLLLARFGMPEVVRGGKGVLKGSVGWLGSPLSLDAPSLTGQLMLDVERGQFLKAEPGIAKLLGVLSLQALPRRLTLDFRDVFTEGFSFDFVRGDARIDQGVARTNNLQMKGVNAAVLMEGEADIGQETQDVSVVVVPEINAGTASLIATAINPAVGIGTFLAQFLLRQPLQAAATQQFHVTGQWADPQVNKVERRPPDATPAATLRGQ